jgi:glycosyltransferase involved in cell wall biosynthesis
VIRSRVAFLIQTTKGYGGERVFDTVLREAIADDSVTPIVVTIDEQVSESAKQLGVEHWTLDRHRSGARASWKASRNLRDLAIHREFASIVSFMSYANVIALLAGTIGNRRFPVVISEHTQLTDLLLEEGKGRAQTYTFRRLYPRADQCLAVSNAVRMDLIDKFGVSPFKVKTVGNPISIDRSRIASLQHLRDRSIKQERVRLASVGALKFAKGHVYAIRAMCELPESYTLDLVGDGPLKHELEQLCRSLGISDRVRFHGYLADPMSILGASDVLLQPSLREGFGLSVIEAGLLGVPVVATNVGGLPELVPGIVPGVLVPPRNVAAIVRAVVQVVEDRRGDSQFVIQQTQEFFSPGAVARRYIDAATGQ